MRACWVLLVVLAFAVPVAHAQQPVRLAAPEDCLSNPGCGEGLRDTYGVDVAPAFTPLAVPDAGVAALDDGVAEVAVVFSTDPQASRPDLTTLADDRRMLGPDRVVPLVGRPLLRALERRDARALRARMDAVSRLLTTLQLRALNQQVGDGRLPEAVGGEWAEGNGLGVRRVRRSGPRVDLRFQAFAEAETVAHAYGYALRSAGFRVRVAAVGGLRAEAVAALRSGRADVVIDYAGSLGRFLGGGPLRRALARRADAVPLRLAPGENRNLFVMKAETARTLGVARLSDLARFWPAAG